MRDWLRNLIDAALLRTAAFERLRLDPDAFFRGFLVILAVGLLSGLPRFAANLSNSLTAGPMEEAAEVQEGVRSAMGGLRLWLERANVPPAMIDQIVQQGQDSAAMSAGIGEEIANLPTILPRSLARSAVVLGGWLSRPFAGASIPLSAAVLATWLGYGVWVMLTARLLGGQANLQTFFGMTALFALPHLLGIFSPIPVLGGILGALAFLWGLAIYIKATAVSHRLSPGRSVLAVFLPFLAAVLLLIVIVAALAIVAALVSFAT